MKVPPLLLPPVKPQKCAATLMSFNGGMASVQHFVGAQPMFMDSQIMQADEARQLKCGGGGGRVL
jgi:hypothetical protein